MVLAVRRRDRACRGVKKEKTAQQDDDRRRRTTTAAGAEGGTPAVTWHYCTGARFISLRIMAACGVSGACAAAHRVGRQAYELRCVRRVNSSARLCAAPTCSVPASTEHEWSALAVELRGAARSPEALRTVVAERRGALTTSFLSWLGDQAERADATEAAELEELGGRGCALCDRHVPSPFFLPAHALSDALRRTAWTAPALRSSWRARRRASCVRWARCPPQASKASPSLSTWTRSSGSSRRAGRRWRYGVSRTRTRSGVPTPLRGGPQLLSSLAARRC